MDQLDDATIIARSREDRELFATVFDRHFDCIHRFLSRRIGDQADDLTAEVFSIAFEGRHRFQPLYESALPWLYGIASNLLSRERRAEFRRLRALARLEATGAPGAVSEAATERTDATSLRHALFQALAQLQPRDRDALLLVAWEGLTYDEVAAVLQIPVGTVRSRLNRARQSVRASIAVSEGDGPPAPTARMSGEFDA